MHNIDLAIDKLRELGYPDLAESVMMLVANYTNAMHDSLLDAVSESYQRAKGKISVRPN